MFGYWIDGFVYVCGSCCFVYFGFVDWGKVKYFKMVSVMVLVLFKKRVYLNFVVDEMIVIKFIIIVIVNEIL